MIRTFSYFLIVPVFCLILFSCSRAESPVVDPDEEYQKLVAEKKLDWHDLKEYELEGKGWPDEQQHFHRIPDRFEGKVTDAVWGLSKHSAGIALNFRTDAPEIYALWSGGGGMTHMPATGVSGLDLYRRQNSGDWEFIGIGKPRTGPTFYNLTLDYMLGTLEEERVEDASEQEYLLFLPLYNAVTELQLGLEPGSTFEVIEPENKPIVFYGTSIVQGGCASRTGMSHTGILRRWLDREIINLGFSGSAKMEPVMAEMICEIDASLYVIDCMPNMTMELTEERFRPFLEIMHERKPSVPIMIVEHHLSFADDRNDFMKESLTWFREIHDAPVGYIHRESLEGTEFGYVDGIHPTDLGFVHMSRAMKDPILELLGEKEGDGVASAPSGN